MAVIFNLLFVIVIDSLVFQKVLPYVEILLAIFVMYTHILINKSFFIILLTKSFKY